MADQGIPVVPTDDDAGVAPGLLMHFSEMRGFTLPDNLPDIRGWKVRLPDGRRVGKVDDLIVDTDDLTVKYLEVRVDHDVLGSREDSWVLVPIGAARLDDDDVEAVIVDRLPTGGLERAPRQYPGHPVPTRAQEREVRDYFTPATKTAGQSGDGLFDQDRFWGRRGAAGGAPPADAVVVEAVVVEDVVVEPQPTLGRSSNEVRPRP
jgi:sporulation protein YlmC with PRC-barrel domain